MECPLLALSGHWRLTGSGYHHAIVSLFRWCKKLSDQTDHEKKMQNLATSLLLSLIIPLSASTWALSHSSEAKTEYSDVAELVAEISAEDDVYFRHELASALPEFVELEMERTGDTQIIDLTATLLEDPLDVIRGYAADALGRIGPRAGRVTPLLLEALRRGEAELPPTILAPSAFSGISICIALDKIGTTPRDSNCREGIYHYN